MVCDSSLQGFDCRIHITWDSWCDSGCLGGHCFPISPHSAPPCKGVFLPRMATASQLILRRMLAHLVGCCLLTCLLNLTTWSCDHLSSTGIAYYRLHTQLTADLQSRVIPDWGPTSWVLCMVPHDDAGFVMWIRCSHKKSTHGKCQMWMQPGWTPSPKQGVPRWIQFGRPSSVNDSDGPHCGLVIHMSPVPVVAGVWMQPYWMYPDSPLTAFPCIQLVDSVCYLWLIYADWYEQRIHAFLFQLAISDLKLAWYIQSKSCISFCTTHDSFHFCTEIYTLHIFHHWGTTHDSHLFKAHDSLWP